MFILGVLAIIDLPKNLWRKRNVSQTQCYYIKVVAYV